MIPEVQGRGSAILVSLHPRGSWGGSGLAGVDGGRPQELLPG